MKTIQIEPKVVKFPTYSEIEFLAGTLDLDVSHKWFRFRDVDGTVYSEEEPIVTSATTDDELEAELLVAWNLTKI